MHIVEVPRSHGSCDPHPEARSCYIITTAEEPGIGIVRALHLLTASDMLALTTSSLPRAHPCSLPLLQLTEEEKRVINRRFEYDGEEGQVEMLCGRRKSKKTYEYEVKWVGRRENKNSWITREKCAAAPRSRPDAC